MIDIFELAVIVAINGVIDIGLVAWVAGVRSKNALLNALTEPDEKTQEAIYGLLDMAWNWLEENGKMAAVWNWLMSAEIATGKDIKTLNEQGEEVSTKETVTPFVSVCRGISQYVKMTVLGKSGGDKANEKAFQQAIAADLQDPSNPLGGLMRSALPNALARAQKTGDYGSVVQLVLMPMLQDWIKKRAGQTPVQTAANNPLDLGGLRF